MNDISEGNMRPEKRVKALANHLKNRDVELNGEGLGTTIHCDTYYYFMAMSVLEFVDNYDNKGET